MNQDKPLFSVIMPFHNPEPSFMQEAVDSILAQTYPHWELMLVDDGSTGPGTELALRYAARYPQQIHYLEHPGHENRGASASRQVGIAQSSGNCVALLDADDLWLPHKLEQQSAILQAQTQADALYGNTLYWYSWTGLAGDPNRDTLPSLGVPVDSTVQPPTLLPMFLLGTAAVPCTCSLVVRREVFDRIGGFEPAFRTVYTDQVLYAKLALHVPIYVAGACWDRYRQHPSSSCAVAERAKQLDLARVTFLRWLEGYLHENDIRYASVWQALRSAQWQMRHPVLARLIRAVRRRTKWLKSET